MTEACKKEMTDDKIPNEKDWNKTSDTQINEKEDGPKIWTAISKDLKKYVKKLDDFSRKAIGPRIDGCRFLVIYKGHVTKDDFYRNEFIAKTDRFFKIFAYDGDPPYDCAEYCDKNPYKYSYLFLSRDMSDDPGGKSHKKFKRINFNRKQLITNGNQPIEIRNILRKSLVPDAIKYLASIHEDCSYYVQYYNKIYSEDYWDAKKKCFTWDI